ncbi:MAG TPA: hypothetical protein PKD86_02790 [Gemmatales bacterium]|nr:hypothetical protein [Gemmatales bacterium]
MVARLVRPVTWGLLLAAWLVLPGLARADWAVATLRSVDHLLEQARSLAKLADREDFVQQLEPIVRPILERGIDSKRPLGVAIRRFALDKPPFMLFVPVTSPSDFVELLTGFGLEVGAEVQGTRSVITPDGQKLFLRFAHGYAFAAESAETLREELPDPVTSLPKENLSNLFALTIRTDQIPSASRQFLHGSVDREMAKGLERRPGESDAQHFGKVLATNLLREVARNLILETRSLSLTFNVDDSRRQLVLEARLDPEPGTALAQQIAALGRNQTLFAAAIRESAGHILLHLPLAAELRKNLNALLDRSFQEEVNKLEGVVRKAVAEKVYRTLEPTLKQEVLDAGLFLVGPTDQRYALLGALQVRDGKRIEALLRDLVKEMPEADRQKVALDSDSMSGVAIHRLSLPPMDEDGIRTFGSSEAYVAFLDRAVLVGLGLHGATAVKSAIAQVGSSPSGSGGGLLEVRLAVARLAPLVKEDGDRLAAAAKQAFTAPDQDAIRVELRGGEALHLRVEASAYLVRLAALLAPLGDQE